MPRGANEDARFFRVLTKFCPEMVVVAKMEGAFLFSVPQYRQMRRVGAGCASVNLVLLRLSKKNNW